MEFYRTVIFITNTIFLISLLFGFVTVICHMLQKEVPPRKFKKKQKLRSLTQTLRTATFIQMGLSVSSYALLSFVLQ